MFFKQSQTWKSERSETKWEAEWKWKGRRKKNNQREINEKRPTTRPSGTTHEATLARRDARPLRSTRRRRRRRRRRLGGPTETRRSGFATEWVRLISFSSCSLFFPCFFCRCCCCCCCCCCWSVATVSSAVLFSVSRRRELRKDRKVGRRWDSIKLVSLRRAKVTLFQFLVWAWLCEITMGEVEVNQFLDWVSLNKVSSG